MTALTKKQSDAINVIREKITAICDAKEISLKMLSNTLVMEPMALHNVALISSDTGQTYRIFGIWILPDGKVIQLAET